MLEETDDLYCIVIFARPVIYLIHYLIKNTIRLFM